MADVVNALKWVATIGSMVIAMTITAMIFPGPSLRALAFDMTIVWPIYLIHRKLYRLDEPEAARDDA